MNAILDRDMKLNANGYEQIISTLTAVSGALTTQKFYTVPFADMVPVVTGNGAFSTEIMNWRSAITGEGFESGVISHASNQSRLGLVGAEFDVVKQTVHSWAKAVQYSLIELNQASLANNMFSLIEARERSRRTEFDLGIQKFAFYGMGASQGLLNQSGAAIDTSIISKRIHTMTSSEFNTFAGALIGQYRAATNYTALPTHLIIPEKDRLGLCNYPNADFPLKSKLQLLTEAFREVTMNPNFQILSTAYNDKALHPSAVNRYVLLNYDATSLKLDLPVPYTMTMAGTQNGFSFENAAYAQFAGVALLRPKELQYFDNTAT
jgi:hypothetical protein